MSTARQNFVSKYNSIVQQVTKGTGIFPETIFSQAIIESQDSKGNIPGTTLAKTYNNFFGIKDSDAWTGKVVNLATKEIYNGKENKETDGFRVYSSPEDSFRDYVKFLQGNERYKKAGVFSAKNVSDQAQKLQAAGYATNPNYATLISSVAKSISSYITPLNIIGGIAVLILICGTIIYFSHD